MNNLTISEFKINLGYSRMFGERDTPEEALKFCNEMLDSSPHKLHIDHITAFMVYINTLITHLEKAEQSCTRKTEELKHFMELNNEQQ